jgi:predicted nucleic acid-binding protein
VAAGTVDCLIAAHAIAAESRLFSLDEDLARIARHSDLELLAF